MHIPECDTSEKGKTVYQIVVPTVHRQNVLGLAHVWSFGDRYSLITYINLIIIVYPVKIVYYIYMTLVSKISMVFSQK